MIHRASSLDKGDYTCEAHNILGKISRTITVVLSGNEASPQHNNFNAIRIGTSLSKYVSLNFEYVLYLHSGKLELTPPTRVTDSEQTVFNAK